MVSEEMDDMEKKTGGAELKKYFLLLALSLVIVVTGFTGWLNLSSFHQNYLDTLMTNYSMIASETIRNIEYAVKYGKPLEHFYGIEQLLKRNTELMPEIEGMEIIGPDGRVIYDEYGAVQGKRYTGEILKILDSAYDREKSYSYKLENGKYYLLLPINGEDGARIGALALIFDKDVVNDKSQGYSLQLAANLLVLAPLSALLMYLLFPKVYKVPAGERDKKRLLMMMCVVLSGVQLVSGSLNYALFQKAYYESELETTERIAHYIRQNITKVTNAGIPYEELYGLDEYLRRITESIPSIAHIVITDPQGETLYASFPEKGRSAVPSITVPLGSDLQGKALSLGITISEEYLAAKMRDILLDMLTVLVTSILFMIEITLFFFLFIRRRLARKTTAAINTVAVLAGPPGSPDLHLLRPLTFLLSIGIFLSASFIPLAMKQLYEPLWGLSETVVLAFPTSVEMLCAALATILAGRQVHKRGWKPAFQTSLWLLAGGMVLSGLAGDMLLFVLARGVAGGGYGYMMVAMKTYINSMPSEKARSAGISAFFAGLYAGMNCGVVVGAMLADRVGFSAVFYMAAVIVIGVMLFSPFRTKNYPGVMQEVELPEKGLQVMGPNQRFNVWLNGKIVAFFALFLLPTTVCGMFLDYYFPVFAESIGASSSSIGRAFLLNGMCIVYLGPLLSRWCEKYLGAKKSIVLSSVIMGLALLFFSVQGTLTAAMIAIVLFGVADSFGIVAGNNYYMRLVADTRIGVGKAVGYYDNVRKLGQMLGPLVFGGFAVLGMLGIGAIGAMILAAAMLFLVTSKKERGRRQDVGIPS